ncbi:ATP-dependent RNA helicase DDX24 isoform X2 [Euwallacea fornicatus]|uniref:ATP-dependent RNA helicase DDX24 isoform X2 n=1 Tax=Euwallacea fornicatus TaxID=995702 RepID=UPI00338D62D8
MAFVANKWKPVQLDGALFSNGLAEGLIGIEECTDYGSEIVVTSEKKRKRKAAATTTVSKKKKKNTRSVNSTENVTSKSLKPSISGKSTDFQEESNLPNLNFMEAWEQFALPTTIIRALEEQGFNHPTEIQTLTLPPAILGRRDILGAAETGSGKTLAFGLPILAGINKLQEENCTDTVLTDSDDEEDLELNDQTLGCVQAYKIKRNSIVKPLYALILTPTRELALQVTKHLTLAAKYTGIKVAVVVGGMAAVKQERLLSKNPEIVVATPGRLWELIQQGNEHLSQIDNIKFLAIDETDRMMERGHFKELHELLERINLDEKKKNQRQNFVFSATLTLIHDIPKHLVNRSKIKGRKLKEMSPQQKLQKIVTTMGVTNPKIVDLSEGKGTSGTLTECRITCSIEEKDYYVYYFLKKHPGRTLIFCNSIGCVKRLTNLLGLLACQPLPLHASMQQRQRLKNLEKFRDDENSVLIATDVAARGLDIPKIDHVLHYQTPRTSESYVHRSGRTARASKQGITVLIMEPSEFSNYVKLCRTLGKGEDLPMFPVQDRYLTAVKQRVNLARDLDKLQLQVRKANSEEGWLQKAAKEMDIIVDEMSKKYVTEETNSKKKASEVRRRQLTALLAKPIFPSRFVGKFPLLQNEENKLVDEDYLEESAINVMKSAMARKSKKMKLDVPLYKPQNKKKIENSGRRNVVIKLNKEFKAQVKGRRDRGGKKGPK